MNKLQILEFREVTTDDWLRTTNRTPQFQAFLDSLERPEVKRIPTPRQTLGSTWATRHFNPQ